MKRMIIKGICSFLLLGIVFGACGVCAQEGKMIREAARFTDRVSRGASAEEKAAAAYQNPYFFPYGAGSYVYQPEFALIDENGKWISCDEATVEVTRVKSTAQGILYRLEICCEEEFYYGSSTLELGYFYVGDNKIIRLSDERAAIKCKTEEDFLQEGTIVCQEDDKPDALGEDEKGWHEYITIEEDRCEYHSWNSLVETGFYEAFIWEEGKGLAAYWQGYGAQRDHIEIHLVEED